jgi:ribosomal protein S18 acetylase RimI-like enzyme
MILDDDPNWGSLLDNLHVAFQFKRKAIGRKLMQAAAENLLRRGIQKFYLWVLGQNHAAQQFYTGRELVETCLRGPFPDLQLAAECTGQTRPDC